MVSTLVFVSMLIFGYLPGGQILFLPAFILMLSGSGRLGLSLSALDVRFRDIGFLVPFGLQLLLFMTPIVYPSNLVPCTTLST